MAMYLADNGIISPEVWIHNKYLRNNRGETV